MTSRKQIDANRRNAALSSGPKTLEGKNTSRLNAIKHGLRAEALDILPHEDADAFARRVDGWLRDFDPGTDAEAELIRRAATTTWKLDRADRHEAAVLSRKVDAALNACESEDVRYLMEEAAIASFDPSNEGERLRRYQSRMLRELRQSLDMVLKLKKAGIVAPDELISTAEAIAPNEPISAAGAIAPNEPILESVGAIPRGCSSKDVPEECPALRAPQPKASQLVRLGGRLCMLEETSLLSPQALQRG